ncbi:transcriptional regulator NrdR [Fervidibacter sacchari]|jgi:transcriptional regulator NrdR|uniref:Transcriptional repressor NrdR n=1 Tax=Candidatus Fervidibacter sacchari TaxID=1448929 RepID=A0ABT2ENS7_9BACT|nr:transcriptional regulator NrdR [Candidatus Fervidibacter sacchari]MCS3919091.1 transcriptional repressor NrdR [Candidatus Fervidibacter sacchari]WKU17177.1 transcriptional regulator NrdR [Candidatus Fervidibacter sacchari]
MLCPRCGSAGTKVIDSRLIDNGFAVRRRRLCPNCGMRFTTHERLVTHPIWVIKKDGRRELFNRQKVEIGMMKACEKRPVSPEQIKRAVDEIEWELQRRGVRQITSREIGDMVMSKLLEIDDVAYIRFASVYQEFDDARRFAELLASLQKQKAQQRRDAKRKKR